MYPISAAFTLFLSKLFSIFKTSSFSSILFPKGSSGVAPLVLMSEVSSFCLPAFSMSARLSINLMLGSGLLLLVSESLSVGAGGVSSLALSVELAVLALHTSLFCFLLARL